jgi:hypothetical protein
MPFNNNAPNNNNDDGYDDESDVNREGSAVSTKERLTRHHTAYPHGSPKLSLPSSIQNSISELGLEVDSNYDDIASNRREIQCLQEKYMECMDENATLRWRLCASEQEAHNTRTRLMALERALSPQMVSSFAMPADSQTRMFRCLACAKEFPTGREPYIVVTSERGEEMMLEQDLVRLRAMKRTYKMHLKGGSKHGCKGETPKKTELLEVLTTKGWPAMLSRRPPSPLSQRANNETTTSNGGMSM